MPSIPIALTGGLIGAVVALLAFTVEYTLLRTAMAERTKRRHQRSVFDATERQRISALARFMICVPPAFAILSWYFWG